MTDMNTLTRTILLLTLFAYGAPLPASNVLHKAHCLLRSPNTQKEASWFAEVTSLDGKSATEFRIYPAADKKGHDFVYRLEVGQEFITSVSSVFLTGLDRVFLVEWQWGAKNIGITLYKLGADDRPKEIFRGGGSEGYRIVELSTDGPLKLIILDKDDSRDEYVARIYSVVADGIDPKPLTSRSRGPFSFQLHEFTK
jgi:hypothetical protein